MAILGPCNCTVIAACLLLSRLMQATLDEPLFGRVEIIPRHLLILDRTSCNHRNFVTLPPFPPATPPPGPGSSVSDTCKALYDLIRSHFKEPFSCRLQSSCDRGIQCELEILDTSYEVVISISDNSTPLSMMVRDSEGMQLVTQSGMNGANGRVTNITLPRPVNSNLSLIQDFDPGRSTVSLQVCTVQRMCYCYCCCCCWVGWGERGYTSFAPSHLQ